MGIDIDGDGEIGATKEEKEKQKDDINYNINNQVIPLKKQSKTFVRKQQISDEEPQQLFNPFTNKMVDNPRISKPDERILRNIGGVTPATEVNI